ncbi:MAG TPA: HEAT repeat domain-containing protein [Pirellulales bacterium]
MKSIRELLLGTAGLCAALVLVGPDLAQDHSGNDLVQMVVKLLSDQDKDLRAVGLDQVRNEAKGEAATRQFAAELPKLLPAAQAALLSALADRGDAAALPAVLELLRASREESVRCAAIAAVGSLGAADNLPLLLQFMQDGTAVEKSAARAAVQRLRGESVPSAIAAAVKKSSPPTKVVLIEILTNRRALHTVGEILTAAGDDHPQVRTAAMSALSQMASAEHIPGMLTAVLRAAEGTERDQAEKAVASVANRIKDPDEKAGVILSAWSKCSQQDQIALLPTLGRVGGPRIYVVLKAAMASGDAPRREAGLHAICNWPEIFVADELHALAEKADSPAHRAMLFQAFVRLGCQRDKRSDSERLERMKQAMAMAKTNDERALIVQRCRTSYSVESLRYVLPYLEKPEFAQLACETIVELAHHRELREPNKSEFDPALDRVIKLSKDAVVVDRANRYKRGETWARPNPADAANLQ